MAIIHDARENPEWPILCEEHIKYFKWLQTLTDPPSPHMFESTEPKGHTRLEALSPCPPPRSPAISISV